MSEVGPAPGSERRDNGLQATAYVALADVDPDVGLQLLSALGRARIAAYLDAGTGTGDRRLFVATEDRGDARTIVLAAVRPLGGPAAVLRPADQLADADTDAAFTALVAGWHVDTVAAVRNAERDLSREDADWRLRLRNPQARDEVWLEDDHYIPPAPPPLPRLAGPTIVAITVLVVSIVLLGLGGFVGIADRLTLVLGIGGILVAAGILFSRIREQRGDEDDDGSAI